MYLTQQIKKANPLLSYKEAVKVLLYHHKGSIWIYNLQRDKLKQSMDNSSLYISKKRKALQPFVEYVLGEYYNGVDKYCNQIE